MPLATPITDMDLNDYGQGVRECIQHGHARKGDDL